MTRVLRALLPLIAAGGLRCASAPPPTSPACPEVRVQDGEVFRDLAARSPGAGRVCLRYHRASAEVAWAVTPRAQAPVLTITRSALELREDGQLVGAWYGLCDGAPPLRQEVAPEATHYMLRFLTLRRPVAVQVRVGARVSAVDLMFALETMREFGYEAFLDPRPLSAVPACQAVKVVEPGLDAAPPAEIPQATVDAVVSPRVPLIQSCFRRTVRPLPCSSLVRRVDLDIDARGTVTDAVVADHTFGTPDVDACVGAAIWDLVFPPPEDGRPRRGTLRFQNCEQTPGTAPGLDLTEP